VGARAGVLASPEKPPFRVSAPPEFKGEPRVWTPEDLLVGAVNACTLTTFIAFATRVGLEVEAYASDAEGTLQLVDGRYVVTRVVVRPHVLVRDREAVRAVEQTFDDVHRSCIVSNSIRAEVVLEPTIEVAAA
jgi:organic hydroperoxide reductase OsmC/OhrA